MYTVVPTNSFENDVKYYIKKKKFTNIIDDIKELTNELEKGNLVGENIQGISSRGRIFKARVGNTDTNAGKSNGYRIIYYEVTDDNKIYLLTIYYKKENNRIPSNKEIKMLLDENDL